MKLRFSTIFFVFILGGCSVYLGTVLRDSLQFPQSSGNPVVITLYNAETKLPCGQVIYLNEYSQGCLLVIDKDSVAKGIPIYCDLTLRHSKREFGILIKIDKNSVELNNKYFIEAHIHNVKSSDNTPKTAILKFGNNMEQ